MLMGWSFAGGVKQFFLKTGSDVMTGEFEGEGFKSLVQGRQLVHCSHVIQRIVTPSGGGWRFATTVSPRVWMAVARFCYEDLRDLGCQELSEGLLPMWANSLEP